MPSSTQTIFVSSDLWGVLRCSEITTQTPSTTEETADDNAGTSMHAYSGELEE
jgi:hypothetical protein